MGKKLGSFLRFFWESFGIKAFQPAKPDWRTTGGKLGSFRRFFYDGIESKGFLTPEKRFRNDFHAAHRIPSLSLSPPSNSKGRL